MTPRTRTLFSPRRTSNSAMPVSFTIWINSLISSIVILFVPLIGVLTYFITRPKDYDSFVPTGSTVYDGTYEYPTSSSNAGPAPAPRQASDLAALASMHDNGVITDSEFESIRGRVVPAT